MKKILISTLLSISCFADIASISQFEANFTQTIVDDKNKTITYKGHVRAAKPQYALWNYMQPVQKDIYIYNHTVYIVEPDLEQVVIKKIDDGFNFFSMLQHTKKIDNSLYVAHFKERRFYIRMKNDKIISITYHDELENKITILFTEERINEKIDTTLFKPKIPQDYDRVRG